MWVLIMQLAAKVQHRASTQFFFMLFSSLPQRVGAQRESDVDARNTCSYLKNIMFRFILHEIIYIRERRVRPLCM
jgi:hypothetical protein